MRLDADDVVSALGAANQAWKDAGGGANPNAWSELLADVGLDDFEGVRMVLLRDSLAWTRELPIHPTVDDVVNLIAAASLTTLSAGIRLGRFTSGEVPDE